MRYILTVAQLTFHEAWRRRMVLPALGLSAVFLALYGFGFNEIRWTGLHHGVRGMSMDGIYNFLLLAGLYVVHFMTVALAIIVSVDTVAGEIGTHTIQTMATKPMRRWQLMCGKWLGFIAMMAVYVAVLGGGVLGLTYAESHYVPPNAWAALALPTLEAFVLISMSLLAGTYLSTMTAGVALFLLYGLAFIGAWVEQVGTFLHSQVAGQIGIVTSLVMPVESLWRRTAFLVQPPTIGMANFSPFSAWSAPSASMVEYAAVYALVAFALAVRGFSRRDL